MEETITLRKGSSPLARGPLGGTIKAEVISGLIPARAGTTYPAQVPPAGCRAHPRSRGDHSLWEMVYGHLLGSSPLARGPLVFAG